MFQAAGYATAHIGKWHLGYTPEMSPNAQGFDHSFGHMGNCIDNDPIFFIGPTPTSMSCIATASSCYFAMNMPHYPYQGYTRWLERLKDVPYPRNLYNAFVASMDQRIGDLVATLDELGLRHNAIIVFQSDNGHSTKERAHYGGGSSGPYPGAKFSLFEGGLRLPAIISWPGKLVSDETRSQVAHSCDWLPTLAELCGVEILNPELDRRSLGGVLRSDSGKSPHDVLHWQVAEVCPPTG